VLRFKTNSHLIGLPHSVHNLQREHPQNSRGGLTCSTSPYQYDVSWAPDNFLLLPRQLNCEIWNFLEQLDQVSGTIEATDLQLFRTLHLLYNLLVTLNTGLIF